MFPTPIIRVDSEQPDEAVLQKAADLLRAGKLVVFPTETVYGLGANALDDAAAAKVFEAKGRPANNPLIVHVAEANDYGRVVSHWPDSARRLAERFWPGPLTLVLPKHPSLPATVTAGGATVAIRAPAHPVARRLIQIAHIPVAAPSANRSGDLSPTTAEHVLAALGGRVDLILDGGPTQVGIESTVIDLTAHPPRLLRPGHISPADIEAVIGTIVRLHTEAYEPGTALPSPGMLTKHYAPRTPMKCVESCVDGENQIKQLSHAGLRIAWVTFKPGLDLAVPGLLIRPMPKDRAEYAARLYSTLHELDRLGLDQILVELPPATEEWLAVRDRLTRAQD